MHLAKNVNVVLLSLALGTPMGAVALSTPPAYASARHANMHVSETGTFEKLVSPTSFKMKVGMLSYTVKTDAMTHVTLGGQAVKVPSLRNGEAVTVKGVLDMGSISATSVIVPAMDVTGSGTFEKLLSPSSFRLSVGMQPYVVTTDATTHVTLGGHAVKLSALVKGDAVTIKGVLDMGSISAISVSASKAAMRM